MGFFDNLKEKATDLAQAGVAQSKRVAEIAKLKTANLGEEDNIKKAYVEIGKLYYAEKGLAPEGAYAAACEKITAAKAAIEANNDRIAELKVDNGDAEVVAEAQAVVVDDAEVTAADFADEVKEVAGEIKEVVEDMIEDVKEEVQDVIDEIKD
jgi:gas vesicle protein